MHPTSLIHLRCQIRGKLWLSVIDSENVKTDLSLCLAHMPLYIIMYVYHGKVNFSGILFTCKANMSVH